MVYQVLWHAVVAITTAFQVASGQLIPFPSPSNNGSSGSDEIPGFGTNEVLSQACQSALNMTINCNPRIRALAAVSEYTRVGSARDDFCNPACSASLAAYHGGVVSACQSTQVWEGAPNTWRGDIIWHWFNLSCATDSSGQLCPEFITTQFSLHANISDVLQMPTDVLCSNCMIDLYKTQQSSPYSGYDNDNAAEWAGIQQICGISHPTAVPELVFNISIPGHTDAVSTAECISGQFHTVSSSDNCSSIALSRSVNSGTLRVINNLLPDCSNLKVGQQLCLPQPCQTYVYKTGDRCATVSAAFNIPETLFISWNPTINPTCSNQDLVGTIVCVSSPYAEYVPAMIPGVVPTPTGGYAEEAVAPPGLTGPGSTLECGKWYIAADQDYCAAISVSRGIELSLFLALNPSIDAACSNLVPGLAYCVQPTINWNITTGPVPTTLPYISAPGPTPSGTTPLCNIWYHVVAGDNCFLIQRSYGITTQQLVAWNPSLDTGCSNLVANDWYCVRGPSISSTASATVTQTTPSTASTTTTRSTSSTSRTATSTTPPAPTCTKTYTVVSGDFCFKIWTDNGITEAQLRAWNPTLNSACSLSIGQVLCVGMGIAAPTSTSSTRLSTSTTRPASTTSSAGGCLQTYTVVSGDFCFKIWTENSITEAQLRAWNPTLSPACDLSIGQVLCVRK